MTGQALPPVVGKLIGDTSHFQSAFSQSHTHVASKGAAMSGEMHKVEQSAQKMGQTMQQSASTSGGGLSNLTGQLSGMSGTAMAAVGAITGVGIGIGGLGAFALSSANTFKDFGLEVGKLSRTTGDSVESMSRWDFAARDVGVGADQLGTAFKFLSKDIAGTSKGGADALKEIGVATKDAAGQARPMTDVMLDISEKFAAMDDPAEKNALAMKIFGRSGMDLIPILNKGKDGLTELMGQAEKFGMVMDQDGVQKSRENAKAQRELGMAWQGLQMQIGQYVLPVLTQVTKWFTDHLQPAIAAVKPAMEWLANAWGEISAAFSDGGPSAAMDKFTGLLGQLGEKVGPVLGDLWNTIVSWLGDHWQDLVAAYVKWQAAMYEWVARAIPPLLGKLGELLAKIGAWIRDVGWPWLTEHVKIWADAFVQWVSDSWPGWVAAAQQLLNQMGNWILTTGLPWLRAKANEWVNALLDWVGETVRRLPGELGTMVRVISEWFYGSALPWLFEHGKEFVGAIRDWVIQTAKNLPNDFFEVLGVIRDFAFSIAEKLPGWIGDLTSTLVEKGRDLMAGLWNGIKDFVLNALPGPLRSALQSAFGIAADAHSPARIAIPWGVQLGQGMGLGVADELPRSLSAAIVGYEPPRGVAGLSAPVRKARLDAVEAENPRGGVVEVHHHHHGDIVVSGVVGDEHAVMDHIAEGLRKREGRIG